MRRIRLLVAAAAIALVAATVPVAASAATTYRLAGVEVSADPATFVGSLVGQRGLWKAVVAHDPLSYTGTTTITGGSFAITVLSPPSQTSGTIAGGTIVAGPVTGSFFCSQTFALGGALTGGGTFAGVLTHYGILGGGRCNAVAASFVGQVTL